MSYLIAIASILICYFIIEYVMKKYRRKAPEGYIDVPTVEWEFPIIGHGIQFSRDIIGFIRDATKKYGPVFRIKIFRTEIVVVSDRSLIDEYFKITEKNMSLYTVLDKLYFSDAFSDDPTTLPRIIKLVKSTIAVNFDQFAPKIIDEAKKMINRMKKQENLDDVDLPNELIRFVAYTSARCFMCYEMTDEFYAVLVKFTHFLNKIVPLTYFFPKSVLRMIFNKTLSEYRHEMTRMISPEIEKYRNDPSKKDSIVFRKAVDYYDDVIGRKLTNTEIADVIVCLLYVSSENTALGLTATMVDLSRSEEFWNLVKNDSRIHLENNDVRSLFNSEILNACLMESARINTHIFALHRKPIDKNVLGQYYVGGVDSVALCEPMLMNYEQATDVFKNPEIYNPDRFLKDKEPYDTKSVMTWGSGVHLCPGKMFAIYEIKAAMALITNTFQRFNIEKKNITNKDYFSPSAFAERSVKTNLTLLDEKDIWSPNNHPSNHNDNHVVINNKKIIRYDNEGNHGWLIQEYFDRDEQIDLYKYTVDLSKGSPEHTEIMNLTDNTKVFPITYYNLVYTGKSNCNREPTLWFQKAQEVWNLMLNNKNVLNFNPDSDIVSQNFNSFYSQMYAKESSLRTHKDEYSDWGISISIGASCVFNFGNHRNIILNSGDVFIADFSKVYHGVKNIIQNSEPGWMTNDYNEENLTNNDIQTFNRVRMSIQIRNVKEIPNKISTDDFKNMIANL